MLSSTPSHSMRFSSPYLTTLRRDFSKATVISSRVLTATGASRSPRVKAGLPAGMVYHVGNYLAILPLTRADYQPGNVLVLSSL